MAGKDSPFLKKSSLNCKGNLVDIATPIVMGIVNVTPDSFFDGSRYTVDAKIKARVAVMMTEGVDIIDIGGVSTRPKSTLVSEKEELKRVLPAIELIVKEFPTAIISIDTFRAEVAKRALDAGAHLVNDISAGNFDSGLFDVIADYKVPYIMMHQMGTFETMHESFNYENLLKEMIHYFSLKIAKLHAAGVADIIVDPGFGFSKTLEQNYHLLKNLSLLQVLEVPILAGISRKSMITKALKLTADDALNGTTILNTLALLNGASILRVHDVGQAKQAIQLLEFYTKQA